MGKGLGKSFAKGLKSFIENISESECDEYNHKKVYDEEEMRLREDRLTPYDKEYEYILEEERRHPMATDWDDLDEMEELSKFGFANTEPTYTGHELKTLEDFRMAYLKIYSGDFEYSKSDLDAILAFKLEITEIDVNEYLYIRDNYTS